METRQLESGDWVIDLGRKWYRVHPNGRVVTKTTTWRNGDECGSIRSSGSSLKRRSKRLPLHSATQCR